MISNNDVNTTIGWHGWIQWCLQQWYVTVSNAYWWFILVLMVWNNIRFLQEGRKKNRNRIKQPPFQMHWRFFSHKIRKLSVDNYTSAKECCRKSKILNTLLDWNWLPFVCGSIMTHWSWFGSWFVANSAITQVITIQIVTFTCQDRRIGSTGNPQRRPGPNPMVSCCFNSNGNQWSCMCHGIFLGIPCDVWIFPSADHGTNRNHVNRLCLTKNWELIYVESNVFSGARWGYNPQLGKAWAPNPWPKPVWSSGWVPTLTRNFISMDQQKQGYVWYWVKHVRLTNIWIYIYIYKYISKLDILELHLRFPVRRLRLPCISKSKSLSKPLPCPRWWQHDSRVI